MIGLAKLIVFKWSGKLYNGLLHAIV